MMAWNAAGCFSGVKMLDLPELIIFSYRTNSVFLAITITLEIRLKVVCIQCIPDTFIIIFTHQGMVEIKIKSQINAPTEKVWNIISNINDDPKFWKGTTAIRNLAKEDNMIIREVTIGKVDRCLQTITLFPKEGIHIRWTKGFINGTKDIVLVPMGNATHLEVVLEYKLSGMASFLPGKITKDLQREADEAVRLIKEKAEGKMNYTQMEERKSWADLVNEKHPGY